MEPWARLLIPSTLYGALVFFYKEAQNFCTRYCHVTQPIYCSVHHSSGVWRAPGSLARGKFLEGLDERSAALADYKAARSKAHENAEAWRLEAKILERIDRLEEAIAAWGHYVSLNPEDKDAKSHLDHLRRR